ncbi:hypothetical protein [Fusobacterium sp.]|jgi:hypothetical protein|uniref:hypothetical protein n=1 Tax=Fusobacterium sp. TaxID=68766 RepID=UPI001DB42186|nr:hypothetical protein [Fusobacterium sp.]MBS5790752.1 hypothetical protein [Fusobacterium sp.]
MSALTLAFYIVIGFFALFLFMLIFFNEFTITLLDIIISVLEILGNLLALILWGGFLILIIAFLITIFRMN